MRQFTQAAEVLRLKTKSIDLLSPLIFPAKCQLPIVKSLNLIHPTLELAVDDDYIRKNPSKGVYRSLKTEGAGAPPKKRIALTMTQQKNFLRFISKSPMYSHWLPVMVVLLGTGMRVAECTGLSAH